MSQAKVDRYKEEKANRKKIMAKQKRKSMIAKICGCVVLLVLAAWLGYSVYDVITRPPTSDMEINVDAIDTYIAGLDEDEEETAEEETEEETSEDEDVSEEETSDDVEETSDDAEETSDDAEETSDDGDVSEEESEEVTDEDSE